MFWSSISLPHPLFSSSPHSLKDQILCAGNVQGKEHFQNLCPQVNRLTSTSQQHFIGKESEKKTLCVFIVSLSHHHKRFPFLTVQLTPHSHHPPHITFICFHTCCQSHPYLNLVTLWTYPCASSQHYPWAHPAAPTQPAYTAAIHPYHHLHLLTNTMPHKVTCTVLSPAPVFISVHTRWPSMGTCSSICLCSDHGQIEEDITNINLQLLKCALATRLSVLQQLQREVVLMPPLSPFWKVPQGRVGGERAMSHSQMLQETWEGCCPGRAFVNMWELAGPLWSWRCWARTCVWRLRD